MRRRSGWLRPGAIMLVLLCALPALANAEASLSRSICFFGRWDLRHPDRAITVNTGSYLCARFTGSAIWAHFDTVGNRNDLPTIAWKIDGAAWNEDAIQPWVELGKGLPAGTHTVTLMVRGLDPVPNRWSPPLMSEVTFQGFQIPDGALQAPLSDWVRPKLKIEFLGDSITDGWLVHSPPPPDRNTRSWISDALHSYPCATALKLRAAWRQVGFGGVGLQHGGLGGVPGALYTFNFFYAGCPRDDWQPDVVVINQGTNDWTMPSDEYTLLYGQYLSLIRQGYPQAKIVAMEPFTGRQGPAIRRAVENARRLGDRKVYYIDTTGWYNGPMHPPPEAAPILADRLAAALRASVLSR